MIIWQLNASRELHLKLIVLNLNIVSFYKEWMFHFRGSLLEIRCPSIVHPWSPLARCRICSSLGAAAEINGLWYDWVVHSKVHTIFFSSSVLKNYFYIFNRTENAFQTWLKKGVTFNSTDYVLPAELCAMVNVVLDAKQQSFKLCAVDGVDVVF